MLRRLIAFSLTQRIFMLLLAGLVAALGAYAFRTIPIDAFPNVSPVQVKMILKAPGMTPEEVESRVITPLEMELLGIPRQTILRSAAKYAIADITLDFEDGTDIYWARQQVAERLEIFNAKNGFVFSTIHNIQCNTPVENVIAMFKTLGRNVKK